jgi:hypothetical protein
MLSTKNANIIFMVLVRNRLTLMILTSKEVQRLLRHMYKAKHAIAYTYIGEAYQAIEKAIKIIERPHGEIGKRKRLKISRRKS